MYGLFAAMSVEPALDPSVEYGENGTLGRCEVGYLDIVQAYWLFRIRTRQPVADAPDTAEPVGAAVDA